MELIIFVCVKDRHSAYIRQLFPSSTPLSRIKVKVFGNSGVGKSTLIESLKCGYFGSLLRKAGITSSTNQSSIPQKGGNGMENTAAVMNDTSNCSFSSYFLQFLFDWYFYVFCG